MNHSRIWTLHTYPPQKKHAEPQIAQNTFCRIVYLPLVKNGNMTTERSLARTADDITKTLSTGLLIG